MAIDRFRPAANLELEAINSHFGIRAIV
jgi:hypothetical protein